MTLNKEEILALKAGDVVEYCNKEYVVATMMSLHSNDELIFFTSTDSRIDEYNEECPPGAEPKVYRDYVTHLRLPAPPGHRMGPAAGLREQFAHHWDSLEAE